MSLRSGFFAVLRHTVNPLAMRAARAGRGPFWIIRHAGRRSGTVYETPLILAAAPQGFVAELTYGEDVAWYRNVVAAHGRCTVLRGAASYAIDRMDPLEATAGRRAFSPGQRLVLRLLRRREFRLLHVAGR